MDPITCSQCTDPYTARDDGRTFVCPCGDVFTAQDICVDLPLVWVVDDAGTLGIVTDPAYSLKAFREALEDLRQADTDPCPAAARRHASDVMDSAQQLLAEAAAVGLTAH